MKMPRLHMWLCGLAAIGLMWWGGSLPGCVPVVDEGEDHGHGGEVIHLDTSVDPTGDEVEIGHKEVDGRIVQLILEPAKSMWMLMGGNWMEMPSAAGEDIHVEVKISDPSSKTRIPHSAVEFHAENITTGATMEEEEELHPMWGGSGLHYAINHGLLGDGEYRAEVHLVEPQFARSMSDADKWMGTVEAEFEFVIENGLVTDIAVSSGTEPEGPVTPVPPHDPPTLPTDPADDEVFMGEATTEGMRIQLIFEPAKAMWMFMGGMWMEMAPAPDETIHVEVKPVDEGSGTRISHAAVTFTATNTTTGESMTEELHSMWGGSGLHYAVNHGLLGPGGYAASVTVGVPEFARSMADSDKWMSPIRAEFTFTLDDTGRVAATEGHPAQ